MSITLKPPRSDGFAYNEYTTHNRPARAENPLRRIIKTFIRAGKPYMSVRNNTLLYADAPHIYCGPVCYKEGSPGPSTERSWIGQTYRTIFFLTIRGKRPYIIDHRWGEYDS